jgi:hypothetical protein
MNMLVAIGVIAGNMASLIFKIQGADRYNRELPSVPYNHSHCSSPLSPLLCPSLTTSSEITLGASQLSALLDNWHIPKAQYYHAVYHGGIRFSMA